MNSDNVEIIIRVTGRVEKVRGSVHMLISSEGIAGRQKLSLKTKM